MNRFLIIYPGALGDTLLTRPVLFYLKKQFPNCQIDYVGNPEYLQLLENEINKIYDFQSYQLLSLFSQKSELDAKTRSWLETYNYIIFWSSLKDQLIQTKLNSLKNVKFIYQSIKPPTDYKKHQTIFSLKTIEAFGISIEENSQELIRKLILKPTSEKENLILIHPGSGSKEKNLLLEFYTQVKKEIKKKTGFETIFILGPAEQHYLEEIQKGQLEFVIPGNVLELKEVLGKAKYYLGNDSGVTHLATQLGLPTIAIFSSTNPIVWSPIGKKVLIVHNQKEINKKFHFMEKLTSQKLVSYFLENIFTG